MKIGIDLKSGQIAQDTSQNNNNEVIVGIDLGTTNSLVAYVQNGSPVTVKGGNGHKALVPSIVYFSEEGDIIVG